MTMAHEHERFLGQQQRRHRRLVREHVGQAPVGPGQAEAVGGTGGTIRGGSKQTRHAHPDAPKRLDVDRAD